MAIKILVDVKGFENGYASYEIESASGSIVDDGTLGNDEVNEIMLYPSASSRMTYTLNISTMGVWGNFNDMKSKIEVVNSERPEYTFLVDNSVNRSKDQWRIWSKSSIDLTITSAGRFDDEEIDITLWNTDGTIDYKNYAPPKPETQIIYDVTNADIIDEVETTVFDGERVILKAEDGYMFESAPTISYNYKTSNDVYLAQDSDFVKVNDFWVYRGTELEVEIPNVIQGENVTSYQSMFREVAPYNATQVTKVTSNNPNIITMRSMFNRLENTTLDLTNFIIPNDVDMSYMFHNSQIDTVYARTQTDADKLSSSTPKPEGLNFIVSYDKTVEFDTYINDDDKSYYWIYLNKENFPDDDISQLIVIGKAVERTIEINYKLQYCSVEGVAVTEVSPSKPNFKVVLVCDDGYIFKSEPFITYITDDQYSKKINGIVSDDKTTATLEFNELIFGSLTSVEVLGIASVKPMETTIASNLATIYKVDDDVLREVSLKRFRQPNELLIELYGDFERKNAIDLASFIISLKHFFIDVPSVQEEDIKIGFLQTEINAPVVAQDSVTLDLGDIEIVGKQDNINDYSNTVVSVYLAFIGIVTLDSVLVVNKTINTRYEVNLYNGDCQVFITNCDDVIVYMGTCNISADIPYIYDYDRKVNSQLNFYNSMNFMEDLESYVLVRSKIPVNSSLNLTEDNKETIIGNEKGLNYFTDFKIEFIADEQEKNELQILLENGIII